MRDYGKVYSSFWSSQTIRTMSEDARNLALYLLTCPHGTIAGIFRLPDGYACEDLQWTNERVQEGFAELFRKGFANRCETTKWVFILEHFDWNKPENPNQWKSASKIADQVPAECAWAYEYKRVFALARGDEPPPERNPSETLSKPVSVAVTVTEAVTVTGESASEAVAPPPLTLDHSRSAENNPPKQTSTPKGSRLPDGWSPSPELLAWTSAEFPGVNAKFELQKFGDYWRAKTGADARKADWSATWRNWIRRAGEQRQPAGGRRHNEFENRDYTAGVTSDGTF